MKKIIVVLFALLVYAPIQAFEQSTYWKEMGEDYVPSTQKKKYTPNYFSQSSTQKYFSQQDDEESGLPKKHSFEIGLEYSDYKYREPHMDHPIKNQGKKQGISAKYTRNSVTSSEVTADDPTFASLEFRYMTGKVDYDGWWSSFEPNGSGGYEQVFTPLQIKDEKDFYMEFAFKFGRYYQLTSSSKLWPYIGVGYRWLKNGKDEYKELDNGQYGFIYQRTSHYFYAPLGANLAWDMSDTFCLTLNAEFDWLLRGLQNSHTSEEFSQRSSIKQNKGYGLRTSIKLDTDLGKWGIFIEPFWRYWKIQNSDKEWWYDQAGNPVLYLQEPFNTTREYGLRAGVTF